MSMGTKVANMTDWLQQLVARVESEPGWRVELTGKGPTAYAPDGTSIVPLKDLDTDPRWRKNTLSELRRAGLDLYKEFKSSSTASKRVRRARATRAATAPRPKPTKAPAPAQLPLPDVIPRTVLQWRLSPHAREQAEARNVALQEVYAAITHPTQTRDTDNESGRKIYQRGDLALVVAEDTRTVITVLPPGRNTPEDVVQLQQEAPEQVVVDLRRPAPIFEPPADAAALARKLSDEFLLCREIGHPWRPWQAFWNEEDRRYERAFKCQRCKTQKWQKLSSTGANLGTTYHHAEGYLIQGVGRIVGTARDSLRLESVMRMVDGNLRGVDKSTA